MFGLHLTITPPEEGTIEVKYLDDYTATVNASDPVFDHQAIYSFTQTDKAIEDDYKGESHFLLNWTKTDGTIKSEQKVVILKRNVMTNIKVSMKNPNPSSIAIEEESENMISENVEWIVE